MASQFTAKRFVEKLKTYESAEELKKYHRYFKFDENPSSNGDKFIGVRMGQVFALAKEFIEMPTREIEKLLESRIQRYAIEHLDEKQRVHYRGMKNVR